MSNSALKSLTFSLEGWRRWCATENRRRIELVSPGGQCYVDMRAWGSGWYESLDLPGAFLDVHVVL